MANHHGKLNPVITWRESRPVKIYPLPEWRSTFPVRYLFIDFGCSIQFPQAMPLSKCSVQTFLNGRDHQAPECVAEWMRGRAYNPFPADIYMTARVIYGLLLVRLYCVPNGECTDIILIRMLHMECLACLNC
jgi:hypothetical protein